MSTVAIEKPKPSCIHDIPLSQPCEWCEWCDLESALEAQNQAEECSDMNVFHRY